MALMKIYEEGHSEPYVCRLFLDAWAHRLSDKAGDDFKSIASVYKDGGMAWYSEPQEQTRLAKTLLHRMLHEGLFEIVDRQTRRYLDRMIDFCSILEKTDYSSHTDEELCQLHARYVNHVVTLNEWGMLVTLMEMGQTSVITEACYAYLVGKATFKNALERIPESLSLLCTPSEGTFLREKTIEEIKTAKKAQTLGLDHPKILESVHALHKKYAWVSYGYVGPALPVDHFFDNVKKLSKDSDLALRLERTENEEKDIREKHQNLEAFFGFDEFGKRLFLLARTFMFQKEFRKQVLYRSFFAMERFRKELSRRGKIPLNLAGYLLPEEIPDAIRGKMSVSELSARKKLCVDLAFERSFLVAHEAKKFTGNLDKPFEAMDVKEFTGQCAYAAPPVRGKARLVFTAHDLEKLSLGDILVSPATSPVMVLGMKIAGAIVTDQGGLTCHAAIVSRELKKPCVIGTKNATRSLKDGDLIEVDSMKGTVRKLQ
ncbi:MAG TPA: PEP-utilizing enzyme [Candidatus Norongarragalinales archaeon]|nr:PEP-utilizing enzyme [Candidatus Norongarragalinales archaeon]